MMITTMTVDEAFQDLHGFDGAGIWSDDFQTILHFAQTHHRLWCRYFADWCRRETYSATTGLSPIATASLDIYEYVSSSKTVTIVKWALSTILVVGLLLLRVMAVTDHINMVIVFFIVAAVSRGWRIQQRRRNRCHHPKLKHRKHTMTTWGNYSKKKRLGSCRSNADITIKY
jgi:hypothetical protein